MRRFRGAVAVAVGVVLLVGCGAGGGSESAGMADSGTSVGGQAKPQEAQAPVAEKDQSQPEAQPSVTRAIIKTGSLTVEADDVEKARQRAIEIVGELKGQIASENTNGDPAGQITTVNLVLKVPGAGFETAIQRLSELGKRLRIQQDSADVTEQVVDVDSRIRTQRASLDRMRALLAKANTVGEIVSVESELTRREADLEALLAKQKNLALQTELATLTLTLAEKGKAPVDEEDDRGFLAGLKGGWGAFTATFAALATALGAMLPFLVMLALIGVPLWRWRARRQPSKPPASAL